MRMDRGDMLITGVKGELSLCKPDIFARMKPAAAEIFSEVSDHGSDQEVVRTCPILSRPVL
jgi:hypothetical protein